MANVLEPRRVERVSRPVGARFHVFERYRSLIDDWEAFTEALSRPLPVCVWANPLRITAEALRERLTVSGLDPRPLRWWPEAFRVAAFGREGDVGPGARFEFIAGLYHVQEEVSLVPPRLLDSRPGERVLDLCAAPGGKTAQIALAMANRGTVVANDRDFGRLATLRSTLDRLGAVNVTTTQVDGANYPPEAGLFDRVLVDVPCSCEGTSRKSPEVLDRIGPESSRRLQGAQRALLRKAVQLTRPGGCIVYSTCTYAPEENEEIVGAAIEEHPGVLRLEPVEIPGLLTRPGITRWQGRRWPRQMERALRIWPHDNDTGGFFVAVLEKTGVTGSEPGEAPSIDRQPGLKAVGEGRWRGYLEERFGVGSEDLGELHIFRRNRRLLGAVAADHRPPPDPEPRSVGMPFVYPEMRFPKLTTAGARLLAPHVRRHRLETSPRQADAYLRRRAFPLEAEQRRALSGPGFVLVCHGGHALGLGLAYRSEGAPRELAVESLSPKRWASVATGERVPGLLEE
jgi:NOL1/NOP2/sun family putative RNA methylase